MTALGQGNQQVLLPKGSVPSGECTGGAEDVEGGVATGSVQP